ncbi:hypothetical protein [Rhodopila sp.]|uniref:hypothetical protein n=1 Tax=Rhodopila sp. TaxID=2480087 RepID=UPI003D1426D5
MNIESKHRKPAITVAFLWKKERSDTGQAYFTGRLGPSRVLVIPIKHPKPGHPTHVMQLAESDTTVTDGEASWLEALR